MTSEKKNWWSKIIGIAGGASILITVSQYIWKPISGTVSFVNETNKTNTEVPELKKFIKTGFDSVFRVVSHIDKRVDDYIRLNNHQMIMYQSRDIDNKKEQNQ